MENMNYYIDLFMQLGTDYESAFILSLAILEV